jgi:hypothetical protein
MTLADLDRFRSRAPFVITVTCCLPAIFIGVPRLSDVQLINGLLAPAIAIIIAALYVGLDIRNPLWLYETSSIIGPQIKTALLQLLPEELHVSEQEKLVLARDDLFKQLTGVFWEAVDRDDQLKAHKPHFYKNGAKYTTSIDVFILCALSGILYLAAYLVTQQLACLLVGLFLVLLAIISRTLALPGFRSRHLRLSEEQLDLLRRNQKKFVQSRFKEIVLARRIDGVLKTTRK